MAIYSNGQVGWFSGIVPPSPLATGLFAVYNADGNTNDSFGTNNGTAMGGLTYTTGKISQAFNFNGTTSYVSLPNNSLNLTGNFSFNVWVNIPSYSDNYFISDFSTGSTYGYGILFGLGSNNKFFFDLRSGSTASKYTSDTGVALNSWNMITVVRETGVNNKIYINSVLQTGSYTVGNSSNNPSYPNIQICNLGAALNSNFTSFKQDATSIWTRTLTVSEISQLYNAGTGKQYPF